MKTLIYTPLYKNSQAIPHIIEHCIWKKYPFTNKWFFKEKLPFTKEITWEITSIISDIWITTDTIINMLKQDFEIDVYNYEKKIMKDECKNMHQWWLIYEAMIKKITNKNIELNNRKIDNYESVKKYYKQYYTPKNFLIFDDNVDLYDEFKLEFLGEDILKVFQSFAWKNKELFHEFVFDESQFYILWYEWFSFSDYRYLVFSRIIFDTYCTYSMRYKQWIYYYESATFDFFNKYIWITVPQIDYSGLDENFFNEAKSYIKSILETWSFKEKILISWIIFWIKETRYEVIKLCDNFQRSVFCKNFDKF